MEAADNGLLNADLAAGIARVKGTRASGERVGKWLTPVQTEELLRRPGTDKKKGKRDRVILALLVGCALRREELAGITFEHLQQRDGRWVIADLVGKGNRVRTVAVPAWAKAIVDVWAAAAGISEGSVLRPLNKSDRIVGESITAESIYKIVRGYGIDLRLQSDLIVGCDVDHMTDKQRLRLVSMIAAFADVSVSDVRVVSVTEANSCRVRLSLPSDASTRLLRSFRNSDPRLWMYLEDFTLVDVSIASAAASPANEPRFEIRSSADGFFFSLRAGDGEVILTSETYRDKAACLTAVETVRNTAATDIDVKSTQDGRPYFELKAANGQNIGRSEIYDNKSSMRRRLRSLASDAGRAKLIENPAM